MAHIRQILLLLLPVISTGLTEVLVETPYGKIQGLSEFSRKGREFFSFKGIPYAAKTERFEVAQLPKPWEGVRKAEKVGPACPHFDIATKSFIGVEECHFANIYTPDKNPSAKLPVMVWIHPGGFEMGHGSEADPAFFMDEDIIIVTFNYRLGAFGFLSMDDDNLPGNLGMKDQVTLLQFVRKTIASFGGDPEKVTIFGCSAGGASVQYHLLSPMSRGLFRNAISQSGSVLGPFALQQDPIQVTKTYGKNLNCPTENSKELKECLKGKTALDLLLGQQLFERWQFLPFNFFSPSVETGHLSTPKFLTEKPIELLKSGKFNKVPYMYGFTEDDGVALSTPLIHNDEALKDLNEDYKRVLPFVLVYHHLSTEARDNASSKVLDEYFGNEEISEETWDAFSKLITDRYFAYPGDTAGRLIAKHAPVYPFIFAFPGPSACIKYMWGIDGDFGIAHADELQYLFKGYYGSTHHTDPAKHEIYDLSEKFVRLWVSFAANNEPTGTWKKELKWKRIPANIVNSQAVEYYHIASETSLSDGGLKDRLDFWGKIDIDSYSLPQVSKQKKEEL